jgi:hypothetical protein
LWEQRHDCDGVELARRRAAVPAIGIVPGLINPDLPEAPRPAEQTRTGSPWRSSAST